MQVDQMRNAILDAYHGDKWKQKVSKMSEGQVIAVYKNFQFRKKVK